MPVIVATVTGTGSKVSGMVNVLVTSTVLLGAIVGLDEPLKVKQAINDVLGEL